MNANFDYNTMPDFEHIENGFKTQLYDNGRGDFGKSVIMYRFYDNDTLIFEADNTNYLQSHNPADSFKAVIDLWGFLSVGEGDTDDEYFANYTPDQLAWRDSYRREELAGLQYDYEENN